MPSPLCLIVNPHAGGGRAAQRLPIVEATLRARGARFRVERTTSLDHARALTGEALAREEVVAGMGGDGLIGALAHVLRDTDGLLGVVPGGRGNDFARKLGISEDPAVAAALLVEGVARAVDVASANGVTYLGIVSAGFDSDVQAIANSTRLKLGDLVYLYGTVRALARWRPAHWTVSVDGERREFDGYSVAVANSGVFGGGMMLAPDASLDDGVLELVLSEDAPRLRFLRNLPKVFKGTHVDEPTLHILPATAVTFSCDRPFTAFADGDPIAELPVTVRVHPGALRVLAP